MTTTTRTPAQRRKRRAFFTALVLVVALVTFGVTALLINILQRRTEARDSFVKVVEIDDRTVDAAQWGKNFPAQYESYSKTTEMGATKYGGAHPVTVTNSDGSTRTAAKSRIEEDPRLVTMWKGYPFSVDYREARGHAYMLEDQRLTRRVTEFNQPGTCLNCHASTYVLMKDLGDGDINKGFAAMNATPYNEINTKVDHPVSCIDCHDPQTMELRITRPAFINGMQKLKESQGVKGYDVNRDASHQDMRAFVCGQCHVEYYFESDTKELVFPWDKGLTIEGIYESSADHVDFTHAQTGTKVLKAQHPEFDLWNQGVHASAGVTCADCHMPYKREGALKVSDHQLQSPLKDINASCGTCHKDSEEVLKERVETIQDRFTHSRDVAMDALMDLIGDIEAAQKNNTPADRLEAARNYHRKASFYIDYLYSENSYGFHAQGESLRIFNDATDAARRGQLALRGELPTATATTTATTTATPSAPAAG